MMNADMHSDAEKPIRGASIISALKSAEVGIVAALPDIVTCDTVLWPLSADQDIRLVQVCKEDEGISICAGLSYCGVRSALLIQHTGFLDSVNAVRAIAVEYRLPIVMLVGLQGMEPDRLPWESEQVGIRILEPICRAMELPYLVLGEERDARKIAPAIEYAYADSYPVVMFIPQPPQ